MESINRGRIAVAFIIALLIFGIAVVLPKLIISGPVARIASTQFLELGLSLLAIGIMGKGQFSAYGFRWPRSDGHWSAAMVRWIPVGLISLGIGALGTIAILLTGGSGNPIVRQLSLPQIMLFVWIFSSTIEEIFTRGFLQSHLMGSFDPERRVPIFRVDYPTFWSALFFGCMHLTLFISGADLKTVAIIFLLTSTIGLMAGHQRARTGSLVPAIGVHMLANIGGVLGGVIYSIISLLAGGGLPGV